MADGVCLGWAQTGFGTAADLSQNRPPDTQVLTHFASTRQPSPRSQPDVATQPLSAVVARPQKVGGHADGRKESSAQQFESALYKPLRDHIA